MKKVTAKNLGFTLLEVLVSITLTALVLGSLFALQSQSKRLSFKAQASLYKVINQRAYLNAAWLSNREFDSYLVEFSELGYSIDSITPLHPTTEISISGKFSLESFNIINDQNDIILDSVRMKETTESRL